MKNSELSDVKMGIRSCIAFSLRYFARLLRGLRSTTARWNLTYKNIRLLEPFSNPVISRQSRVNIISC